MPEIPIRIVNRSGHELPAYATAGASGMDLRAVLDASLSLESGDRALVPTGLFLEIPEGYEAQVRPRSGLAVRQGITCLNTPGTIDSDYRGEIKVLLINLSDAVQVIEPGDRIAQLVIQKVERARWIPVQEIGSTVRNEGGFGHTGKQ